MAEIAVLRTHIVNYAKTRKTYVAYPEGWLFPEVSGGTRGRNFAPSGSEKRL